MITANITFGNILEILTIGVGGLYFLWELRSQLKLLQYSYDNTAKRLEKLDSDVEELAKVTVTIAGQNERLNNLERHISEVSGDLKRTVNAQMSRAQVLEELRENMNNRFEKISETLNELQSSMAAPIKVRKR